MEAPWTRRYSNVPICENCECVLVCVLVCVHEYVHVSMLMLLVRGAVAY